MKEEWRDIKGYEGKYQVSNLGRVKSLKDSHGKYREKILNIKPEEYGYIRVILYREGKSRHFSVHRLVAEAFIPNLDGLSQVNHKDENKQNNRVDNLEWCDRKYNCNYGTRNKRASEKLKGIEFTEEHKNKLSKTRKEKDLSKGKNNPKAHKVKCITTGKEFNYIEEAAEYYHINRVSITMCCQGKYKSAGKHPVTGEKLIWRYLD